MISLTNKSILVTGSEGFLGHHLVSELSELSDTIHCIKHSDYDLRNADEVRLMYDKYCPDIVVHLAAKVGGIQYNQANPAMLFYDNLMMGMNMIDEGSQHNIEKFVCIGTVCMYPEIPPHLPFRETDIWEGYPEPTNAPYGIAKRALLTMCQAYRQQYGMNCIFVIPVNMYGEFDSFDNNKAHVIPMLIKRFLRAKENNYPFVKVWGSGNATREFVYVRDTAKAIVNAIRLYDRPEPVNIGTGQEVSILSLAGNIADIVGYKGEIVFDNSMPDGQPRRCLDITRMLMLLECGDNPVSLIDGLKRTIEWYKKNR